jgi:trimeric autotransporter adhesin
MVHAKQIVIVNQTMKGSDQGYRVTKRISQNQVLVVLPQFYRNPNNNTVDQLVNLAKLKEQGYLTEEEFQIEKNKLLNSKQKGDEIESK